MRKLYLYNTLSREKEEFKPIKKGEVGLYTCGPTVYDYAHIGNLRTYIFEDILKRVLIYNGYKVKHIMNITDVGHLTGDRDMGEDKLEKGAKRESKTAWEIAEFYTKAFKDDIKKLNIIEPNVWCKATDYIPEQIEMIKKLEEKNYAYKISDGIYFNTAKFKDYAKLSHQNLEKLQEGARVEKNIEKKNPTDFALWKFSPKGKKRQMEWDPKEYGADWEVGFPGWHIECSAMSIKCLEDQLDIHCGGIDHIDVHHTNEIAQSEAATGKKFFKYWMHGAFLNITGGKKMAKSEENFLTLKNALIKKGYNPLAYRLMCLGASYRRPLTWSDIAIKNFNNALNIIVNNYKRLIEITDKEGFDYKKVKRKYEDIYKIVKPHQLSEFEKSINDDLNMAVALSIFWEIPKDNFSSDEARYLMLKMDEVLGLGLDEISIEKIKLTREIKNLIKLRGEARAEKNWAEADRLRQEIEKSGYIVKDTKSGMEIIKNF